MHDPMAFSSQLPAGQRRRGSEYLWEAHKTTIKTLYIDEGRSLKDVREIMKSKYGFEGSVKSYKVRLNRWRFSKYITNRLETEALQHLVRSGLQHRVASEVQTLQLSNGTRVSLSSLFTHLERKKSATSMYPMSTLRPPDNLRFSEEMLSSAREYVRRQYMGERSADRNLLHIMPSHLGDFFKAFVAVRRLLQEARLDDALLVLRRAPEQIRLLLSEKTIDNPSGCIYIAVLCIKWNESTGGRMNSILKALMKYAVSVVREDSGPEPLLRILTALTQLDDALFREAVIRTWRCQLQTWTSMIAPDLDVQLLGEWMAFAETAGYDQVPRDLDKDLRDMIQSYEIRYGRRSQPVITLLFIHGEYERIRSEKLSTSTEKARAIFLDLLSRDPHLDMLGKYTAQYFLAKDYRRIGDRANAERYLLSAIESLCELEHRPCYGISAVLELMLDLEQWLTEWEEYEKAKDIHQRRLAMRLAHEKSVRV
ncbi:hypothetical protein J7T55_002503 [Diaporthe amygdali]|uniref:uncharacterized protein n=1 Tax=Phomopsis amygdali TaxID=1214568 RepID=UPI0022FE11B4|nr:uncharacterized protein J7T55_002503 [Diaporthe amygdali]KAJ0121992.1 hypothetical protein J7T55_002503 [Diaporthe amygdali]